MSRFTLRFEFVDVPLTVGEMVAGRAPDCDLVMDDAAVSRRHATFHVATDSVIVRDLGSRNGVSVNGVRLVTPVQLQHGDRIRVGTKELTLQDNERAPRRRSTGTTELVRCPTCGMLKAPAEACAQCELMRSTVPPELPTVTVAPFGQDAAPPATSIPPNPKESQNNLRTLSKLAERALGMGREAEAERLLASALQKILARASASQHVSADEASEAARCALLLAEGACLSRWVDYTLELYAELGSIMPQELVERLYSVTGPIKYSNPGLLRRYVALLHERDAGLGASERFILSRLEGLERMVASR